MANYTELKSAISSVIKQNGNNEITGTIVQSVLLSVLNELSTGATYAGLATPNTNPGIPDGNKFYIATQAGIYLNFGAYELKNGIAIISNVSGSWVVQSIDVQSGTETTMEYVKSIFKKKATLVSQVFNGATFNAGTSTTTIPAGQTGESTTFEFIKPQDANKTIMLSVRVISTGAPLLEAFSAMYLPSNAVQELFKVSDYEYVVKLRLSGTGTREFDLYFQKRGDIFSNDVTLEVLETAYYEQPINPAVYNPFPIDIIKSKSARLISFMNVQKKCIEAQRSSWNLSKMKFLSQKNLMNATVVAVMAVAQAVTAMKMMTMMRTTMSAEVYLALVDMVVVDTVEDAAINN